jgi:hypothetical protein
MKFTDFLKTTVLTSAGAATALAAVTVAGAGNDDDPTVVIVAIGWWLAAAVYGAMVGRRSDANPPIARLLADARQSPALPEISPLRIVLNRLWPLLLPCVVAGALAFVAPSVPAIAAGFAIIWALAWRNQERAVTAIEDRDGAVFYVERTSPFQPIRLVRTPGFRAARPVAEGRERALDG